MIRRRADAKAQARSAARVRALVWRARAMARSKTLRSVVPALCRALRASCAIHREIWRSRQLSCRYGQSLLPVSRLHTCLNCAQRHPPSVRTQSARELSARKIKSECRQIRNPYRVLNARVVGNRIIGNRCEIGLREFGSPWKTWLLSTWQLSRDTVRRACTCYRMDSSTPNARNRVLWCW